MPYVIALTCVLGTVAVMTILVTAMKMMDMIFMPEGDKVTVIASGDTPTRVHRPGRDRQVFGFAWLGFFNTKPYLTIPFVEYVVKAHFDGIGIKDKVVSTKGKSRRKGGGSQEVRVASDVVDMTIQGDYDYTVALKVTSTDEEILVCAKTLKGNSIHEAIAGAVKNSLTIAVRRKSYKQISDNPDIIDAQMVEDRIVRAHFAIFKIPQVLITDIALGSSCKTIADATMKFGEATVNAGTTQTNADAEAYKTTKTGNAEAGVIQKKVNAVGKEWAGREAVAKGLPKSLLSIGGDSATLLLDSSRKDVNNTTPPTAPTTPPPQPNNP